MRWREEVVRDGYVKLAQDGSSEYPCTHAPVTSLTGEHCLPLALLRQAAMGFAAGRERRLVDEPSDVVLALKQSHPVRQLVVIEVRLYICDLRKGTLLVPEGNLT